MIMQKNIQIINYNFDYSAVNLRLSRFYFGRRNIIMRKIISRNPFTGHIRASFPFISDGQLSQTLNRSVEAYRIQSTKTLEQRAQVIKRMAKVVESRKKEIAQTITWEMGKPISDAEAEVQKVVYFCSHYGSEFHPLLPYKVKSAANRYTMVKYLPLGTIYFLVPFNFPFYLNFKGGLPNLLLGNTLLARNADSCPNVGRLTQEVIAEAGFNNGQYQNVYTNHLQIDQILQHTNVQGVSFTGSTKTGAIISQKAGKYLKRAVMELGGNDPFVVLEDADINLAVSQAIKGRCNNAGQVCISPKRFIIHKKHYQRFRGDLIDGLVKIKVGDPMDPATRVGPLAREDLYESLENQLVNMPKSYKLIYQRLDMKKPLFPITVIEGTDEVWDEELFGPCFQLFRAQTQHHALELANHGSYGLGSSVWSVGRGQEFSDKIRAGIGFVNGVPTSDVSFPTGGVGRSGFGRECGSEGYRQFANIKTHYVN